MNRRFSIIFVILIVAGAGWLLVFGLISSSHMGDSIGDTPVISIGNLLPVPPPNCEQLPTRRELGIIQEQGPCSQSTKKPRASNSPPLTMQTRNAIGFSSLPSKSPREDNASADQRSTVLIAPQPAVWVDLGAASSLSRIQQDEIQVLAESLSRKITESGLDPATPEYQKAWEESVSDSDQLFRQRYGNQVWMEHHIQAYHLAHSIGK